MWSSLHWSDEKKNRVSVVNFDCGSVRVLRPSMHSLCYTRDGAHLVPLLLAGTRTVFHFQSNRTMRCGLSRRTHMHRDRNVHLPSMDCGYAHRLRLCTMHDSSTLYSQNFFRVVPPSRLALLVKRAACSRSIHTLQSFLRFLHPGSTLSALSPFVFLRIR